MMRRALGYILYALIMAAFVAAMAVELWVEEAPACDEVCPALCDKEEIEIVIVGDIMAHLPQVESAQTGEECFDFGPHFEGVGGLFEGADYVVANLETTLSPRPPYSGYPGFATPEELARDLAAAGVDAVTLANNHITDKSDEGVLATLAALDNASVRSVGVRVPAMRVGRIEPLVAKVGAWRVAFVACTDLLNRPDRSVDVARLDTLRLRENIERVRPKVDFVVALVHWGEEYHTKPSRRQTGMAEWMRGVGVDVVVGSHPHVIQPWEVWCDESGRTVGGVFYSLGNVISNQNSRGTDCGLVARIGLRRGTVDEPAEVTIAADTLCRLRYTDTHGKIHYGIELRH